MNTNKGTIYIGKETLNKYFFYSWKTGDKPVSWLIQAKV